MSRKSVSIVVPRKRAAASVKPAPDVVALNGGGGVDRGVDTWVSQDEVKQESVSQSESTSSEAPALTFTIPAEPGWIDLAQSLVLPQMVFWSWTVSATKKNLARFL